MLVLKERGKPEYLAKNLQEQGRERERTNNKLNPEVRSRVTLVGGECCHHCAIPRSPAKKASKQWVFMVAILNPSVFSRSIQSWLLILNQKVFFLIFIARKLNKGSLSSRSYASSCKFTSGVAVTSDYVIYATGVLLSVNSLRILQEICRYKGEFKEYTRLLKQLTARLFWVNDSFTVVGHTTV